MSSIKGLIMRVSRRKEMDIRSTLRYQTGIMIKSHGKTSQYVPMCITTTSRDKKYLQSVPSSRNALNDKEEQVWSLGQLASPNMCTFTNIRNVVILTLTENKISSHLKTYSSLILFQE